MSLSNSRFRERTARWPGARLRSRDVGRRDVESGEWMRRALEHDRALSEGVGRIERRPLGADTFSTPAVQYVSGRATPPASANRSQRFRDRATSGRGRLRLRRELLSTDSSLRSPIADLRGMRIRFELSDRRVRPARLTLATPSVSTTSNARHRRLIATPTCDGACNARCRHIVPSIRHVKRRATRALHAV